MRIAAKSIAILVVLGLAIGCKKDLDPHLLKIGYIPIAECVQLYVAQDMGFFEREGLRIELVSLAGGAKVMTAINARELDVGFSNVVSLILVNVNSDAHIYSVFGATVETADHQNHAIIIRKDRQGAGPKEKLKGARIAINTYRNIEELMTRKYLATLGLEKSDVEWIEVPFPRMLPALESDNLDAASIVEPFITIAREELKDIIEVLDNQYLATEPTRVVATYVSPDHVVISKREALDAFVRAMNAATDFIRDNEGEAREVIGKYTRIKPDLLSKIGLSAFEPRLDEDRLREVVEDMFELGYLEEGTSLDLSSVILP